MTLCAECIMNRSSSLIAEARHAVREVFGADTECTLERFVDPEATDSEPVLFLLVRTTLEPAAASEALEQVDRAWWLPNRKRIGSLQLGLQFI